ncbi:hypothetical protein D3C72_801060 [compost metagenome]
MLHSRSYKRSLRNQKWYSLPLHVGSHQCAVGVIVLQERNKRGSYRHNLFWRDIHVIHAIARHCQNVIRLFVITNDNLIFRKTTVFIQLNIGLCDNIVIFFIRSQIRDLFSNFTCLRIYPTVWRFNKAIFVNTSKCGQGVDQTDVRSFRCLNRTHTAIVRVVNVTHFHARTFPSQTTRSECRQTALMRKFRKRVRLVHKLGQLGATEELFDRGNNRTNVDQSLWCNYIRILNGHSLTNHTFHTG